MSLEKGLNRIGTTLGATLGFFLSILSIIACLNLGYLSYFNDKYHEEHSRYSSAEEKQKRLKELKESIENFKETHKPNVFDALINELETEELEAETEDKPFNTIKSRIFEIYMPTVGLVLLIALSPLIFGLFLVKGVVKTLNWIIRGFRE